MDKYCILDGRLSLAASFVRSGAVLCDVGTDHAYLPINLLQRGIIQRAVASDVNRGPLERARASAEKYGVTAGIRFVLANGLDGIELETETPCDISICGMGGELIAKIVDGSECTKQENVRLILQPMTCAPELRSFLTDNGYAITDERLCTAAGKIYTCMSVEYDGAVRTLTPAERILGAKNIENREPLFDSYADGIIRRLRTQIDGMKKGGLDTDTVEGDLSFVMTVCEREKKQ